MATPFSVKKTLILYRYSKIPLPFSRKLLYGILFIFILIKDLEKGGGKKKGCAYLLKSGTDWNVL
jgi:hypothetical protein